MRTEETDVVIVGAGPAGLALAVEVFRRGLRGRILERHEHGLSPAEGALYHPRALACFAQLETYDGLRSRGARIERIALYRTGGAEPAVSLDYAGVDGPFPHGLAVPHADFESVCLETFSRYTAIQLDRSTELLSIYRERGRVAGAVARGPAGDVTYRAKLVAVTTGSGGAPIRAEAGAATRARPFGGENAAFSLERPDGWPAAVSLWLGPGIMVQAFPLSAHLLRVEALASGARLSEARAAGPDAVRRLLGSAAPPLETALKRLESSSAITITTPLDSRVARWVMGGVVLIGPAAHGLSPAGLVAETQAVLDCAALSRVLSRSATTGDFSALALAPYEQARRPPLTAAAILAHDLHRAGIAPAGIWASARDGALARLATTPALARRFVSTLAGFADQPWTLPDRLRLAGFLPLRQAETDGTAP